MSSRVSQEAPRVHLTTLGCAKNLVDSERILARLGSAGAAVGASADEADIILVNTCGFIKPAKEESIQVILRLSQHKSTGRCRRLIIMGCLAQRYKQELRKTLPEADGIFGLGEEDAILRACGLAPDPHDKGRFLLTPRHTAYLRIADGCDNRCAYCAIPDIRGPFRSRPVQDILREAEDLVAEGARELNLIGQDTTLYGTDLERGPRIHELLERLARIRKLRWLRLLYTHPAHFTDELIEAYANIPKLCPYVDMPLQHLNDAILRRMGRKVTQARILDLVGRIRERVPGAAIRTAFIVGFPGETRGHFNELLALVRKIRFEHLGAFKYSREEPTRAVRMRNHVSERAKSRRLGEIMLLQQQIVFAKNRSLKGKQVEVVIDEPVANQRDVWTARMRTQAPDVDSMTYVKGKGLRPGRFLKVRITGSRGYDLLAQSVNVKDEG